MDDLSRSADTFQPPSRKRKLKHPRTARACLMCRRRKVRCSGTLPCENCHSDNLRCDYHRDKVAADAEGTFLSVRNEGQSSPNCGESISEKPSTLITNQLATPVPPRDFPGFDNENGTVASPRRNSLEPPQAFVEGHHVGSIAGVSFLYHGWPRAEGQQHDGDRALPPNHLTSYSDMPMARSTQEHPLPSEDEAHRWLDIYFCFATPTYRYLHRPTLEDWMSQYLAGNSVPVAHAACTLLTCAQALLYTNPDEHYAAGGSLELNRSRYFCEKARLLLEQEPGPATLASVQARLAMCLYLLSTFRINECHFTFSMLCAIMARLGLHRKSPVTQKIDLLANEMRKRTFWSAYILDGYLSVMLGCPRLLRDSDIDQTCPLNIDDTDLTSAASADTLPLHGPLEAALAHAKLAELMGRNSDLLYPLSPLSQAVILDRTSTMLDALRVWNDGLPAFLKPRPVTLAGRRVFERQNTVIKLAAAHLSILVTRRCLLADFGQLGHKVPPCVDQRAIVAIEQCAYSLKSIIDTILELVRRRALFQAFWFTQYIGLVALSTLYVFKIQSSKGSLPEDTFADIDVYLEKAGAIQSHLATILPPDSPAHRHHVLLDRLRVKAHWAGVDRSRDRPHQPGEHYGSGALQQPQTPSATPSRATTAFQEQWHHQHTQVPPPKQLALAGSASALSGSRPSQQEGRVPDPIHDSGLNLKPPEDDWRFGDMVDLDWENLDSLVFFGCDSDGRSDDWHELQRDK